MIENPQNIINANLNRIYNAKEQCMDERDFIGCGKDKLEGRKYIIELMLEEDLIDLETDDLYYLTSYGYSVVENGGLHIEESEMQVEPKNENHLKQLNPFHRVMGFILLLTIPISVYLYYAQKENNDQFNFSSSVPSPKDTSTTASHKVDSCIHKIG